MRSRLLILLSSAILSACSPTQFLGGSEDSGVLAHPGYRKVNTACASVDASSGSVTPALVRQLVHCFNAYGAMDPLEKLVTKLSDDEIAALAGSANRQLFADPSRLYELELTVGSLDRLGLLDPAFRDVGKIFEQKRAILAALRILKAVKAQNPAGAEQALKRLSAAVDAPTVERSLQVSLDLLGSRSYRSLQAKLQGSDLAALVRQGWRQGHAADHPGHLEIVRTLTDGIAGGELLPIFTELTGASSADAADKVARLSSVFRTLTANDGKLFVGVTRLFHAMNAPISCLQGAASIPNANVKAMEEIALHPVEDAPTFVQYQHQLKLLVINSFCSFPPGLGTYFPQLVTMADSPAIEPMGSIITSFVAHHRTELLADLLSEIGGYWTGPALPAVEELQARGAWDDLLLLASVLPPDELQQAARAANFAWDSLEPLSSVRIADADWDDLVSGAGDLVPALERLRDVYFVNDSHPLVAALRGFLGETADPAATGALLRLVDQPEFSDTVDLLATMSRDGRLRQITQTWLMLFRKTAEGGKHSVNEQGIPVFSAHRRHDWISSELKPFNQFSRLHRVDAACRKIDLDIPLDSFPKKEAKDEWDLALACVNSDGGHDDVVRAIGILEAEKGEDGKTLLEDALGLFRDSGFGTGEYKFLVRTLVSSYDNGDLFRWLKQVPLWVGRESKAESRVLEPLVRLAAPYWLKGRAQLRSIEQYVASVLEWKDFPAVFRQAREFAESASKLFAPSRPVIFEKYAPAPEAELERIRRWVGNKECGLLSGSAEEIERQKQARALQIIDEYRNRISSWDLVDGRPRQAFTQAEMRGHLSEMFAKLADPAQSVPEKPVSQALFDVLKDFGREGAHAHQTAAEYLVRWIQDRSTDWRLITFFYPGETAPRVQLVNSLDELELILINVDFKAPGIPPSNYGLRFMMDLGDAWGDEPRSEWPPEIQAKYPEGSKKKPATIRDWVEQVKSSQSRFEKLVGYPSLPKCAQVGPPEDTEVPSAGGISIPNWIPGVPVEVMKRSLYNNRQIIGVLDENVPGASHPHAGGLRFLRDLFFELSYSTPAKNRNSQQEKLNNLSLVTKFARMGLARQFGQQGWTFGYVDPELVSLGNRVVEAAISPEFSRIAATIGKPAAQAIELWQLGDESAESSGLWNEWRSGVDRVRQEPDYRSLDAAGIGNSVAEFFAESSADPAERGAASKLRLELARKLESGELDDFVELASRKPDDFYRVLMALSQSIDRGDIQDFLGVIRRTLSAESR